MAQTIKLKRSNVAGNIPSSSDLALGEIAVNTADGALYIKKGDNTIVAVGDNDILHIDTSNGRVGIGTTSPSADLTVSGTIANDAFTIPNSIGTAGQVLKAPSSGTTLTWADESGSSGAIAPSLNSTTGDGSTTTLVLSTTPINENATIVTFDGVLQHKSTYSLSGNTITFSTAPANGVAVECIVINTYSIQTLQDGDSDTKIQIEETADEDKIRFDTAGTERMIIDASGNVGIGTTSPASTLDIKGDGAEIYLRSADYNVARIIPRGTGTNLDKGLLSLFDTGVENVRIDTEGNSWFNGGNVGIGTTSPSAILHSYKNSAEQGMFSGWSSGGANTSSGAIRLGANAPYQGRIDYDADANTQFIFENTYASGIFNWKIAGSEKMRIDSSGRVGIGTTDLTHTLNVLNNMSLKRTSTYTASWDTFISHSDTSDYGTLYFSGSLATGGIAFRPNNTDAMRITGDGNVGIGTSIAASKLHVYNGTSGTIATITGPNAYNAESGLAFSEGRAKISGFLNGSGATPGASLRFYTMPDNGSVTERLRIDSSGNVGIGTTSPDQKFHVEFANTDTSFSGGSGGAWGSDGIRIENTSSTTNTMAMLHLRNNDADIHIASIRQGTNDSDLGFFFEGSEKVRLTNDGNVGIGTTAPSAKLQVEEYGIDTTETSTTATTQVAIHTMSATTFRSARFTVQVTNSTDSTYHLTEILMIHDGTTPSITEYGTIFTGSAEATFDADISSGNVRLLATPASTDTMEFKVVAHSITT